MNIIDSANYLIQLYIKTGKKYKLTVSKLNYLLVIAELYHLKNGFVGYFPFGFEETHNSIHPYMYIGFPFLYTFYFSDIIEGEVDENEIISEKIDEEAYIPERYKITSKIETRECNLLNDIFFEFGNVSSLNIRNMLNDFFDKIKERLDKTAYKGTIKYTFNDASVVKSFFMNLSDDDVNNPIMMFISKANFIYKETCSNDTSSTKKSNIYNLKKFFRKHKKG